MRNAQEWLDKEYPKEKENWEEGEEQIIILENDLEGELVIADYSELKKIKVRYLTSYNNITKVEIRNCPNLESINLSSIKLKELVTDKLPNLRSLQLDNNDLSYLDLSKFPNLCYLSFFHNKNITSPFQDLEAKIQALKDKKAENTELKKEILELTVLKIRLQTNTDKLNRTITDLTQELQAEKRKLDKLQSNYQELLNELENLTKQTEISIPNLENQTVKEKIKFFNQWLNESKQEKQKLETNIHELQNTDFQKSKTLENQQEEIKQLRSKITLLEQQKNTYQEKFNNSLQFIKDIRKELTHGEEWKPKSETNS